MLYQKILNSDTPYMVKTGKLTAFSEHRHADVEIHYVLKGQVNIVIDKKKYLLIIPASILAFVLSRFGFSKLISVLYPISGYIGIIGLVLIVINYIVVKKVRK